MVSRPLVALALMYGVVCGAASYGVSHMWGVYAALAILPAVYIGGVWIGLRIGQPRIDLYLGRQP